MRWVLLLAFVFQGVVPLLAADLDEAVKLYYEGNHKKSLIAFQTLAQDPEYTKRDLAFYYAGLVSEKLKEPSQALEYYDILLKKFPDSPMVEYARIRMKELKNIQEKPVVPRSGYTPTRQPVRVRDDDVTITVQAGESLSSIALKYYGNVSRYRKIAAYNGISHPYTVYAGQKLVLPGLKKIGKIKGSRETPAVSPPDSSRREEVVIKFPARKPQDSEETEERGELPSLPPPAPLPKVEEQGPVVRVETQPVVVKVGSDESQVLWDRALDYFDKSDFGEALETLAGLIDKFPDDVRAVHARFFRGYIYYTLGNFVQAIPEFVAVGKMKNAAELGDDALFNAAELYFLVLKDYQKARELYGELVKLDRPVLETGMPLSSLAKQRLSSIEDITSLGITRGPAGIRSAVNLNLPSPRFVKRQDRPVEQRLADRRDEITSSMPSSPPVPDSVPPVVSQPESLEPEKEQALPVWDKPVRKPVFSPNLSTTGSVENFQDIVMWEDVVDIGGGSALSNRSTDVGTESEPELPPPTISMKSSRQTQPAARETAAGEEYQAALHVRLARAYSAQGMKGEAIREYEQAFALDPQNPVVMNNLAYLYVETGKDLARARELARKGMNISPVYRGYFLDTLGLAELKNGDVNRALLFFKKAVEEKATAARYLHLGQAYEKAGLRQEALDSYQSALELSSGTGAIALEANQRIKALQ